MNLIHDPRSLEWVFWMRIKVFFFFFSDLLRCYSIIDHINDF